MVCAQCKWIHHGYRFVVGNLKFMGKKIFSHEYSHFVIQFWKKPIWILSPKWPDLGCTVLVIVFYLKMHTQMGVLQQPIDVWLHNVCLVCYVTEA